MLQDLFQSGCHDSYSPCPQCFIPSFPRTQANFLLKCSGCRFAFLSLVFMDFILQPVLTGWSPKWHEWSYFHKDRETSLSGNIYCRKKRGLFPLLGWSVFLLMTDCPDIFSTGLTRKPLPSLFGPYTTFQASYLSPHCIAGQCRTISTWYFRSFKRYLY